MSTVVQIYDNDCTTYSGSGSFYNYMNQTKVDNMVGEGVKRLTGQSVEATAWTTLFPTVSTNKVGIKVNENGQGGDTTKADWTPQVVNGLIKGLKLRGFSEANIYLMDPSGSMDADTAKLTVVLNLYPAIKVYSQYGTGRSDAATWTSGNPSLVVDHTGYTDSVLCDQLLDLTYLVHMPIMRMHVYQFTLTYKNLLGLKVRSTIGDLHGNGSTTGVCASTNNPLVDLYGNTNILNKTRLIIGDAIFGGPTDNGSPPEVWDIFGDYSKRLFFATDPVAIDSVMYDFLNWESARSNHNLIQAAANAGHGTHEHWDNTTNRQYATIDYTEYDMDNLPAWEARTLFRP